MRTLPLLAAALLAVQAEDFQKRVHTDGSRVYVDDEVLFEGPWRQAEVKVVDFGGSSAKQIFGEFEPWKQIVVLIDQQERLRIPVRSLVKPIRWPPHRLDEVKPTLKKLTETVGAKKILIALVSTENADFEIYRGPEYETRAERSAGSFTIYLKGQILYRISLPELPRPRVEDVVSALNQSRLKAGVGPVRTVPAFCKACDLHALYLAKNESHGLSGHDEDPKGVGYTEEGARAGKRSVISPFAPHESPAGAIESLMATLYHRIALLNPSISGIGVGWANRPDGLGFLVVDVGNSDGPADPKLFPIVYPVNGQEEVPLEFGLGARESPNPLPEPDAVGGYPITIQIPERAGRSCDVEVLMTEGDVPVQFWFSTPDLPARKDWPQPGVICLIPKERLKPGKTYHVKFRDRLSGLEKEWSFSTKK